MRTRLGALACLGIAVRLYKARSIGNALFKLRFISTLLIPPGFHTRLFLYRCPLLPLPGEAQAKPNQRINHQIHPLKETTFKNSIAQNDPTIKVIIWLCPVRFIAQMTEKPSEHDRIIFCAKIQTERFASKTKTFPSESVQRCV